MNRVSALVGICVVLLILLWLHSNGALAQNTQKQSLPDLDEWQYGVKAQRERIDNDYGPFLNDAEKDKMARERWESFKEEREFGRKAKPPKYVQTTENSHAYESYMRYKLAVKEIDAAKKAISDTRRVSGDPEITGPTYGQHFGAKQDRLQTRKIITEQTVAIEKWEKRRDAALAEWNKYDYGKTFGNLEKGIHNKVVNPVTREEMDIIGINIGQRKRLDPEKQKYLDWMNKDTRTVLIMINGLPEGHPDKERLKHLVTHDRSMEALTIIESLARDKYIDFEKMKDGSFIFVANEDDPYMQELRDIEENKKIDKIMESYRDGKQKEAEKKKPGVVSVQKTGDTNTSGMKTAEMEEEPKNDAGATVSAGAYEQGDRIVTRDGTEYENKGGQWVKTGSNYGAYEPTDGESKDVGSSGKGVASADRIGDLKNAEGKTTSTTGNQDGAQSGFDVPQNINVTKSYKDGQRSKSKGKAKENLKNTGLTASERLTAGEVEDQRKKGQINSQGQETAQNIGNTQQEGKKAQDTDRIMSETSIGTILAGGLMGGLSAGVATGLDGFFGTLGKGAGDQVSVSTGIQPPPPPNTEPASGTGASTGTDSASGTGATTTTANSGGSGTSVGTGGSIGAGKSTGTGASSGTKNTQQNISMTYAGTFRGITTVTAAYGKKGSLRCTYTAQFRVTLHPNGSAAGEQNGGVYAEFDENGNGLSCRPVAAQSSYTGTHGNGRVTLTRPNRSYSGQYTTATLTASGGGSAQMTLTGPRAGGKPASDRVVGSMSLSRQ